MRSGLDYSQRHTFAGEYKAYDPDTPIEGYYRGYLARGGFPVGIRIWYGAPLDPLTGEEMDRGWRWQATANGALIDLERVWPRFADNCIDQAEHDHLCRVQRWAETHAPDSPQANPTRAVDLLTCPVLL